MALTTNDGGAAATANLADFSASWSGTSSAIPVQAGMASARGLDPSNNTIMLAWGGAECGSAYRRLQPNLLFNPKRRNVSVGLRLAFLVHCHRRCSCGTDQLRHGLQPCDPQVYVFGGYDPTVSLSRGDTYELSITSTGACTSTPGTCTFNWRKLDASTTGLTCYPTTCPAVRRSHRMAEVNYFNRNPGGSVVGTGYSTNGEQPCSAIAPCSYGIFMEGGTSDGLNYLSDRWMFDPTANGSNGTWLKMGEMPPRTLASMAAVDYNVPTSGKTVHRAILFGGETGLNDPGEAYPKDIAGNSRYFVAPTLGDTWMFDYDAGSWNRVELQGKGYNGFGNLPLNGSTSGTEWDRRQAYDVTAAAPNGFENSAGAPSNIGSHYMELSPPALAGAVMVTRTQAPPITGPTGPTTPLRTLNLPEVYLFGGRLKNGGFNTLDHVYKFCAGSTGEAFTFNTSTMAQSLPSSTDYSCDAYDATNNPTSPSPVATYVGRWMRKAPDVSNMAPATTYAAYMGAGAYDTVRDRIVLLGGLTSAALTGTTAVTDQAICWQAPTSTNTRHRNRN